MFIYSLFDFRKLQIFRCFPFPENSGTLMFPISRNSGLQRFPIFLYYVIPLVSCLHPSLVTPSAVGNTSLSLDPQFPLALLYCFRLCNSDPILCTQYNSIPLLSYKYLYSVPRSIRIKITIFHPSRLTRPLLPLSTHYLFPDPEIPTLSRTQKSGIPEGFHREQGNTLSPPR